MTNRISILRSDIKVRKTLPTHLVAQRVHSSRKSYSRTDSKRSMLAGW